MRFFWVQLLDSDEIEIACLVEDEIAATGEKIKLWFLTGSDQEFTDADLIIGTEIHPSLTGLLSTLNREEEGHRRRFDREFAALNDVK
jgi:hypothetical protein